MIEIQIQDILAERCRQDEQWGEQNHSPELWLAVLMEEVGEFSEALLCDRFGGTHTDLRSELVQVAAVSLAMLECCDRNGWGKDTP